MSNLSENRTTTLCDNDLNWLFEDEATEEARPDETPKICIAMSKFLLANLLSNSHYAASKSSTTFLRHMTES